METKPPSHIMYWPTWAGGINRKDHPCTILRERNGKAQIRYQDGTTAIVKRQAIRASSLKVGEGNTPQP